MSYHVHAQTGHPARALVRLRAPCAPLAALLALISSIAVGADTAVVNVVGYTPSASGWQRLSALEFDDDGRITRVHARTPAEFADGTRLVDGQGHVMLPGLIDAHAHLLGQALLDSRVSLTGSRSLEEAQLRVANWLAERPGHSGWVLGRGWNQVLWPGKAFPTAADLNEVVSERPAYFVRIDGHAAWANSAALKIAGITAASEDPPGGRLLRDARGELTGVLIDSAMGLVEKHIPAAASAVSDADLRETVARLNAEGLTGVHQAGISIAEAHRLDGLYADESLDLRLYLMLSEDEDLAAFGPPWIGRHDDRLTVRAVKIYGDGALGSRGAALIEPYSDEPESVGLLFKTGNELRDMVKRVHDAGFQAAVHAIGDAANRQVIDAIEHAIGGEPNRLRHRIEHAQVIALDDIPRVAELGVIASMQPVHATSDMNMAEDRVGPARIRGAYAWRSLLDRGAVIASGSDFPVELTNPFLGIHASVARQDTGGMPEGGWYRNEAMTRIEAITTHTLGGAYAAHQEDVLGSLEVGKWADFILVDRDVMTVAETEIWSTVVLETWIAGERVYRRDDAR